MLINLVLKTKINEKNSLKTPSTIYIYLSLKFPIPRQTFFFAMKVPTQLSYFSIYGAKGWGEKFHNLDIFIFLIWIVTAAIVEGESDTELRQIIGSSVYLIRFNEIF